MTGSFIVIDGADGSGKTTQANLLVEYLTKQNKPTKYMDFPQYYDSFFGKTVARFLRGEFGSIDQVSPYLASFPYAMDRASVKAEMEAFLKRGGNIVSNRYAPSNMAHQGAKFSNDKEREEYLEWVYELEYDMNKIPKEDVVVYLYVPWQISLELTQKKGERAYLQGEAQDIHEKDHNHRILAEKMYLELAKRYSHWITIDCVENSAILPVETIHQKVVHSLKEKGIM